MKSTTSVRLDQNFLKRRRVFILFTERCFSRTSFIFAKRKNLWLPGPYRPKYGMISDICPLSATKTLVLNFSPENEMTLRSFDFKNGMWTNKTNFPKYLQKYGSASKFGHKCLCQKTTDKNLQRYL